MSSELAIMENGMIQPDFSEIRNYRLRQATQKIFRLTNAAKKNLFEISVTLLKIQTEKLYEEDGYSNIYEYGEKVLGYKKAMTNNLVRIATNYIDKDTMKSILATDTGDYSVSQLQELLVIEPADAKQLADAETISPTMSTKAIRKAVKAFRDGDTVEDTDTDETGTGDTETVNDGEIRGYEAAFEEFHRSYNALKEYLEGKPGTEYGTDTLMPDIMNAVMRMNEVLKR